MEEFHNHVRMIREINSSFIVLIHVKNMLESISIDYDRLTIINFNFSIL